MKETSQKPILPSNQAVPLAAKQTPTRPQPTAPQAVSRAYTGEPSTGEHLVRVTSTSPLVLQNVENPDASAVDSVKVTINQENKQTSFNVGEIYKLSLVKVK